MGMGWRGGWSKLLEADLRAAGRCGGRRRRRTCVMRGRGRLPSPRGKACARACVHGRVGAHARDRSGCADRVHRRGSPRRWRAPSERRVVRLVWRQAHLELRDHRTAGQRDRRTRVEAPVGRARCCATSRTVVHRQRRRTERAAGAFLRESLVVLVAGVCAGLAGAVVLVSALRAQIWGIAPFDLTTFATVVMILAVVVLLATTAPARRAARTEPARALRAD